ncbi:unnamed protein product [Gongylonema pulchrum]|uniref:(+)-neomenthol dehydrogenase n=1 Tax=Gongylonema pulchrum TaxID=637853 RepID=A0A183EJ15_9BILA|nr:unnamed protein product [Gongylonema pulchrum]
MNFCYSSLIQIHCHAMESVLRMFLRGAQFKEEVSSKGKVALVTSATTPLGMQTVLELNKKGALVYMLCRSVERGLGARRCLNDVRIC